MLDDFTFTYDDSVVEYFMPFGNGKEFNVIKNEPVHFYIMFNEKFQQKQSTSINIKYFNSLKNQYEKH